jgi:hypothetical protein
MMIPILTITMADKLALMVVLTQDLATQLLIQNHALTLRRMLLKSSSERNS